MGEETHGDEVGEGGHGDDGGGKVGQQPWGAGKAVREVGEGGEEHVPVDFRGISLGEETWAVGWGWA